MFGEGHYKEGCVFCYPSWPSLENVKDELALGGRPQWIIFEPLNPVTKGHVLVVGPDHIQDASEYASEAGRLMQVASVYIRDQGIQANIITSVGPAATQTVKHLHIHIVPRVPDDGLFLPWTPQHLKQKFLEKYAIQKASMESKFGGDHSSVGLFQQSPKYWGPDWDQRDGDS